MLENYRMRENSKNSNSQENIKIDKNMVIVLLELIRFQVSSFRLCFVLLLHESFLNVRKLNPLLTFSFSCFHGGVNYWCLRFLGLWDSLPRFWTCEWLQLLFCGTVYDFCLSTFRKDVPRTLL